MNDPEDPLGLYAVLGLKPTATKSMIRQAYIDRARETHADTSTNPDTEIFMAVRQAYAVLSDEELRLTYDTEGIVAPDGGLPIIKDEIYRSILLTFRVALENVYNSANLTVESFDFMKMMKLTTETKRKTLIETKQNVREKIRRANIIRKQIRRLGDGINIFDESLAADIQMYVDELKIVDHDLDLVNYILVELEIYYSHIDLVDNWQTIVNEAVNSPEASDTHKDIIPRDEL